MRSCIDNLVRINSFESITKHLASIVIIHLTNDDWVNAVKEVKTMKEKFVFVIFLNNFQIKSNYFYRYNYQSDRIDELVDAFDEKDEDAYQGLLKTFLSYTLDNEVLKLAQSLTSIGEWNKKPKVTAKQPDEPKQSYTPVPSSVEPVNIVKEQDKLPDSSTALPSSTVAEEENNDDDDDDDEIPEL
jgi:hypothetical protein